ncbi:hypothetical protein [Enterococcus mundtii]|nr:hypothetical protein [Enterococcus mundtii]
MKIELHFFVTGALFSEEVTSVPAVYAVLEGGKGLTSHHSFKLGFFH